MKTKTTMISWVIGEIGSHAPFKMVSRKGYRFKSVITHYGPVMELADILPLKTGGREASGFKSR